MVSVIIAMYNSEDTIKYALDSVFSQTYKGNIEIIIINDGSTDNSLEVVKNYELNNRKENISFKIINKENGGVSSARNEGFKVATGKYIAILDSDDEWVSNKLERQVKIMEENEFIDLLGGEADNKPTRILFKKINTLSKIKLKNLLIKWHPSTPTVIFKKDILKDVGMYDTNFKYAEDGNFILRVCMEKNAYHLPETMVMTGLGKPSFGHTSGLSGNLKGMYLGELANFKMLLDKGKISKMVYILTRGFCTLKYYRRVIIVKLRKLRS